jgi:hypothetical protein
MYRWFYILILSGLLTSLLPLPAQANGAIIYVDANASGANNGTSWPDAYNNLQTALTSASNGSEIWIADGTYRPTSANGNRTIAFTLKNGVAIYGGFRGNETQRNQRNWRSNRTLLSGDLNGNDGADFANSSENSYRVVVGTNIDTTAILDGVAISGGNANGDLPNNNGGGLFLSGSKPTLTNLTISANQASAHGGGVYMNNSSLPTLLNVTISGNQANSSGGGMYINESTPTLINLVISENNALVFGGGLLNNISNPIFTNVTITGNRAQIGGGVVNVDSNPNVRNTIIWNNAAINGPNILNNDSNPTFSYSVVDGSGGSNNWVTSFGTNGGNNLDIDPLFVIAANPSTAPITAGDFRLQKTSPVVNIGNNNLTFPTLPSTDLAGNPRIVNMRVDLGAYEQIQRIYVNDDASGANTGGSWADAATDLQEALARAIPGSEIWIAAGMYRPSGSGDRNASFVLKNDVALYGGFAGNETALGQRNWALHPTMLSGDLNGDDGPNFTQNGDNSYRVVVGNTVGTNTILDGLIVKGGNATGNQFPRTHGGGLFLNQSNPRLSNLIISGNRATFGGGIYNDNSSPTLTNVTISSNQATASGGGIYNDSLCNPSLTAVIISGNQASSNGGGMWNDINSSPQLTNVILSGNLANQGGGVYNSINSNPKFTNVTITGNRATNSGGALFNSNSDPQFRNSILWANIAPSEPTIKNSTSVPVFFYSLVQGSGGSSNWNSAFGTDNGQNRDQDPLFASALLPESAPTTNGDYRLRPGSPAIDGGTGNLPTAPFPTDDIRNVARPQGNQLDLGAFEMLPVSIITSNGHPQSTGIGELFLRPLLVTVRETNGEPLPNVTISFSAPTTGASALLNSTILTTTLDGNVTNSATANMILGNYNVTATISGTLVSATFSLTNTLRSQTIAFTPPPPLTYGDAPITIFASASSSLPVSFSSNTPNVCSVSGNRVTILAAGTCTIVADQAGDSIYAPATLLRTLAVNRVVLNVAANNAMRTYGAANPPLTYQVQGLVNGDTTSVLTGTLATSATLTSPVGSHPISQGSLTASNYTITFTPATLSITPAPLTITATATTRSYGAANPPLTYQVQGFVNGDTTSVLTGTLATSATLTSSVGSHPISQGSLTASNYTISFTPATLSITPAPLTITANDVTRLAGQPNPSFSVRYSGFVNGETGSVLRGTLNLSTTATVTSPPGSYPITPSGLSSSNYAITFVNGTLRVGLYQMFLPLARR